MTNKKRETFQNRFGFVLACIGSAVGMGNIWLFPYRVGEGGGAAFLIPYFIFVFVLGFGCCGMDFEIFGRICDGKSDENKIGRVLRRDICFIWKYSVASAWFGDCVCNHAVWDCKRY